MPVRTAAPLPHAMGVQHEEDQSLVAQFLQKITGSVYRAVIHNYNFIDQVGVSDPLVNYLDGLNFITCRNNH